jgi:hypothetical protein
LQASLWRGEERIAPVLSDKIGQLLSTIEVLPLKEGADEKYAEMRMALERAGTLIGANDLLVATHALSLGLALVTDNAAASFQECQDSGWKTSWHLAPRWIEIVRPASRRPRFVERRDQIMETPITKCNYASLTRCSLTPNSKVPLAARFP